MQDALLRTGLDFQLFLLVNYRWLPAGADSVARLSRIGLKYAFGLDKIVKKNTDDKKLMFLFCKSLSIIFSKWK